MVREGMEMWKRIVETRHNHGQRQSLHTHRSHMSLQDINNIPQPKIGREETKA